MPFRPCSSLKGDVQVSQIVGRGDLIGTRVSTELVVPSNPIRYFEILVRAFIIFRLSRVGSQLELFAGEEWFAGLGSLPVKQEIFS